MRSNRRRRRREKREKYLNANKHDSEIEYTNFPEDEFELPETQGPTYYNNYCIIIMRAI